jgi:uncharacterized protein
LFDGNKTMEKLSTIDRKGLAVFLAVSFGLAWPIVTVGDYLWNDAFAAYATHGTAMLMPGIACLIVRRWVTKRDIRDIGFRIGGWRAYLVVILACFLLWSVPKLIDFSAGGAVRDITARRLVFTGLMLFTGMIPAFGEELGWRGYLLPSLLSLGTRKALLLHGVIWGAWHWPLLFASLLRGEINVLQCILGMLLMLPASACIGLIVGWLWLRSGSILLVTVWHFSYDFFRDILNIWLEPGQYSDLLGLIPITVMFVGACLVLLWGAKRFQFKSNVTARGESSGDNGPG